MVTYVTYLNWNIKNSILGCSDQSNFAEKRFFVLIIFTTLVFTAIEISVVLTFNLDFWEFEK